MATQNQAQQNTEVQAVHALDQHGQAHGLNIDWRPIIQAIIEALLKARSGGTQSAPRP